MECGCSGLNSDLYYYDCECHLGNETVFHFLYDCPFYDVQRERFMSQLNELGFTNLSIPYLFECDNHLDLEIVPKVQLVVFHYIISSNRF